MAYWTDAQIRAFPAPPRDSRPVRIYEQGPDPLTKGFNIRIMPGTGTRKFYLSFTSPVDGSRKQMPLGQYTGRAGGESLQQARDKARQARALIAQGRDPYAEQLAAAEAARAEAEIAKAEAEKENSLGTMADLGKLYATHLEANGHPRSASEVRAIWARDVEPVIGKTKAKDVTPDQISEVLGGVTARAAMRGLKGFHKANRVHAFLKASFKLAKQAPRMPALRGIAPRFDVTGNPAAEIDRVLKRELPRDRHLTPGEVRAVWDGLGATYDSTRTFTRRGKELTQTLRIEAEPHARLAVRWLLATGQRVEEALGMTWSEIDDEASLWILPADRRKNRHHNVSREPHLIALTEWHKSLLKEIRDVRLDDSPYLFPSIKNPKTPMSRSTLSQAVRRWCDRTGTDRFQPRDLRRTWKTLAGRAGIDLEIRNRIQGHAMTDIGSRAYDRWDYLPEKRAAMERWSTFLQNLLSGTAPFDNVSSISSARSAA